MTARKSAGPPPRDETGGARTPASEPSFADVMREKGVREQKRAAEPQAVAPRARPKPRATPPGPVRFTRPDPGEPLLGHAPGLQRRVLQKLRSGQPPPDAEIDLHGMTAREARRELRAFMADCAERRLRCIRIIHGRGRSSGTSPVLKQKLPGWLEEPAIGRLIDAFTPARPEAGGGGATLVRLRKPAA